MTSASDIWPAQVIIVQNGKLVNQFDCLPVGVRNSLAVHGPLDESSSSTGRSIHKERITNSADKKHGHHTNCIHIDTNEPFTIVLYRHKNCTRLSNSFWHVENLDGRSRMGNALDRSPVVEKAATENQFPFPKIVESLAPSRGPMLWSLSDDCYDRKYDYSDDEWILCGYLRQKVEQLSGKYSLRLSPSMRPSRDDHILTISYYDSKISPESVRSQSSPLVNASSTPVVSRHNKRPSSGISEYATGDQGSTHGPGMTPVAFRVSQMTIAQGNNTNENQKKRSYTSTTDPASSKVWSLKRKLIYGGPQVPRSSRSSQ